jgi:hypothetical protein
MAIQDWNKAIKDFQFILTVDPSNSEVNSLLKTCRGKVKGESNMQKVSIVEEVTEEEEAAGAAPEKPEATQKIGDDEFVRIDI